MTLKMFFRSLCLATLFITYSCSQSQWNIPYDLQEPFTRPPEENIILISDLLDLYTQQVTLDENPVLNLDNYADMFLMGYVISSDAWGNFYKELIIQDRPENPNSGIRVLIDHPSLSDRFIPGHQIYIALEGLDLGLDQQMLTLGIEDGGQIRAFTLDMEFGTRILRDTLTYEIIPKIKTLETLSQADMNQWLKINDLQFHRSLVTGNDTATFAAEADDRYDGNRLLETCIGSNQIILQTSVFADFQTQKLPIGNGFAQGILQYDYYGQYPVMTINNSTDLVMDSTQRCDPDMLACHDPIHQNRMLKRYDFETVEDVEELIEEGWHILSNNTNTMWEFGNYSGNRYLLIDGRESPIDSLKTRLITPLLEVPDDIEELTLELDIQVNFAQGIPLSLYLGELNGDQIQWTLLDYIMPIGPSNSYGNFKTLGPISLSCSGSSIVLGMSYEQLNEYDRTRYHIDNIEFRAWPM